MFFKRPLLYIFAIFIIVSCKNTQLPQNFVAGPNFIFNYFAYLPNKEPIVSVHRGGGQLKGLPENGIESFSYISSKMPCLIACDIEITLDSVMVLRHDKTLERTSTGRGKVAENTFENINSPKL
jgi:glycerophosphoryl diester phosphodiesterase